MGKERDLETGWDYFGARYYNPAIARWMNVDPMADKFPSLSSYNYVFNNPIQVIDPDGMCPKCTNYDLYDVGMIVHWGDGDTYEGTWRYLGNHRWETINLSLGNADQSFVNFYHKNGGASGVDALGEQLYQSKIAREASYYGGDASRIPANIQLRARDEANREAFEVFKSVYATQASSYGPNTLNPFGQIAYREARNRAITGQSEGWSIVKEAAFEVGLAWAGHGVGGGFKMKQGWKAQSEFLENGARGLVRRIQFEMYWQSVNKNEIIDKFAPNAVPIKEGRKLIYFNDSSKMQVVVDMDGNYLRIQNTQLAGNRTYVDLDGIVPNNKIINGKQKGNTQAEYNALTHFKF